MKKYTIINGEKVPIIQCDAQTTITNMATMQLLLH